jgi:hypothetical protein
MRKEDQRQIAVAPPLTWRIASTTTIAVIGILSKSFLGLLNTTKVHGLDGFVRLLDERKDVSKRQRGLITGNYTHEYVDSCELMFSSFESCLCVGLLNRVAIDD